MCFICTLFVYVNPDLDDRKIKRFTMQKTNQPSLSNSGLTVVNNQYIFINRLKIIQLSIKNIFIQKLFLGGVFW